MFAQVVALHQSNISRLIRDYDLHCDVFVTYSLNSHQQIQRFQRHVFFLPCGQFELSVLFSMPFYNVH
jgi:hypothetical protein